LVELEGRAKLASGKEDASLAHEGDGVRRVLAQNGVEYAQSLVCLSDSE
jgi:hypothetical protein